jgi:hypothetical protein
MMYADFFVSFDEDFKEIWRFAANIHKGINHHMQQNHPHPTESKTFLYCFVEHLICSRQITTKNYSHRCYFHYHRFAGIMDFL